MFKRKAIVISGAGLLLLLAVGAGGFFLRAGGPVASELIDSVAAEIDADCQPYARSERYGSVYGLCQAGGLRLRLDDLSRSSDEQTLRFKAAMRVSCYAGLDGQTLRINTLENEGLIVSTYFIADFADSPDLSSIRQLLAETGRSAVQTDICQRLESVGGGGVRFTPLAWSDLSDPAETLATIGIQCADNTFRLVDFGIVGLSCSSEVIALDLNGLTRPTEDALSNGFEYLGSCPAEIRMELIRLGGGLYVMTTPQAAGDLSRQLADGGQEPAEVVEFCLGAERG